jgi:hypothetical protein
MRIYLKGVTPECLNRGSTILTTTRSNGSGGQFRSRLNSRRFENLTVLSKI